MKRLVLIGSILLVLAVGLNCGRIYRDEELWSAAADGDLSTMRRMLAWGASPDTKFESDNTALQVAAFNNELAAAELLLRKGADPTIRSFSGETAYDMSHTDEMRKLLRRFLDARVTAR